MSLTRWFGLCLLVALSALLAACGGGGSSDHGAAGGAGVVTAQPVALEQARQLPGLPGGAGLKSLNAQGGLTFDDSHLVDSAGAVMNGTTLTLGGSQLSWAILGANTGGELPASLQLSGTCSGLYIAASDYGSGCWRWLGGEHSTAGTVPLPAGSFCNGNGSIYIALVCPPGGSASIGLSASTTTQGSWNLLVWMAADNNLATDAVNDLNEMEAVGSTEHVTVLAGYDIDTSYLAGPVSGTDTVNFIKVVQDTNDGAIITDGDPANTSSPRAGYNSADPDNLTSFLEWAEANFPAERTFLVLWNHGDGWLVGGDGKAGSGVLSDDTDGPWEMTGNTYIAAALGSRHFDLIGFDACNMGHIEALYDYRGKADYFVASEVLEPGAGWDYTALLTSWNASPSATPQQIGQYAVDGFTASYAGSEYCTLGVFSGSGIGQLVTRIGELAALVTPKADTEKDAFMTALGSAFEPESSDGVRDLKGFIDAYREQSTDNGIDAKLAEVLTAFDSTVVYFGQVMQPGTNGLGLWLPDASSYTAQYSTAYDTLAFDDATGWLALREAVDGGGGGGGTEGSWAPGDYVEVSWGDTDADFDLIVQDPNGDYGNCYWPDDLTGKVSFSLDSGESGQARESATLEAGGLDGAYYIRVDYYDHYGTPPATLTVTATLYDSSGSVKQELGQLTFNGSDTETTQDVATLTK